MPRKNSGLVRFYQIVFPEDRSQHPQTQEEFNARLNDALAQLRQEKPEYPEKRFRHLLNAWAAKYGYWRDEFNARKRADENWSAERCTRFEALWNDPNIPLSQIHQEFPEFRGHNGNIAHLASTRGLRQRTELRAEQQTVSAQPTEEPIVNPEPTDSCSTPDALRAKFRERVYSLLEEKRIIRASDLIHDEEICRLLENDNLHQRWTFCKSELHKMWEDGELFMVRMMVRMADIEHYDVFDAFLATAPEFYTAEELIDLIPEDEQQRIFNAITAKGQTLSAIAEKIYPAGQAEQAKLLLKTLLDYYVERELLVRSKDNKYKLSYFAGLIGVDPQTLELLKMENELILRREEEASQVNFTDYKQIVDAQNQVLEDLKVGTFDLGELENADSIRMIFIAEALHGHVLLAAEFLNKMMQLIENRDQKPHIVVATGLILGNFLASQILRGLTLNPHGFLNHIYAQFQAANFVLTWAEHVSQNFVFYVLGDDDKRTGHDYALVARAAERQGPLGLSGGDLSPEAARWLKDQRFLNKCLIQWTYIWPYQYRIGRTLMNKEEMHRYAESKGIHGVNTSEYYIIVHILWAKMFGKEVNPDYAALVDLDALFGKRETAHVRP